jgi:alanyl-tRNA synthetase
MKDIYQVELFEEEGFVRKQCTGCGRFFWTLDQKRELCGDTPCVEYTFIGNPPTRRRYTLEGFERAFLRFFKRRGHEVIRRYPVVARWRDDIFLTIASIANFQPWVTSGQVPPPANPLVVSQPSIRLKDIDNVGRSGRHFTLFFMGGHHAFNSPKRRVYWNDRTVELCHEFLTRVLRIRPQEITYIEGMWEGGGNAGEDFEVNVRGLEVATLVFMHYAGEGGNYTPLPLEIVDTGYGLERFVWLSQGTPTSYEAVFGDLVEKLREIAGVQPPPPEVLRENSRLAGVLDIESGRDLHILRSKLSERTGLSVDELDRLLSPVEAVYAIADHLRCLAFMFADGITPSNVREGYLARLVLRRTLRLMSEIGMEAKLAELMAMMLEFLEKHHPEVSQKREYIMQLCAHEERKYNDTLKRGRAMVERMIRELKAKNQSLSEAEILTLYDTHGLPPELVRRVASEMGVEVQVPEDFYIKVAKLHSKPRHVAAQVAPVSEKELQGIRPTKLLYYSAPYAAEFSARIVKTIGEYVVLDRTAFYPEGGGQPCDTGELEGKSGRAAVVEVVKVGDVVLHRVRGNPFKKGQTVRGKINRERRRALMAHHTGTHILLGALRRVLGDHVWQQGAQKGQERSRLDISHFKRITPEQIREIERLCNQIVRENRPVRSMWVDRVEAERRHGFVLYQGGVIPGKRLRIVEIDGWDVQACAGTHCQSTGEVGFFKILRTERIQDGIERIEFAVGDAALKYLQRLEDEIQKASEILRVPAERVSSSVANLFEEWKSALKTVERLRKQIAERLAESLRSKVKEISGKHVICEEVDADPDVMVKVGELLTTEDPRLVIVLGTKKETTRVVVMAGSEAVKSGVDCGRIAAEISREIGGGGGGKPHLGQGGGVKPEQLPRALERALEILSG